MATLSTIREQRLRRSRSGVGLPKSRVVFLAFGSFFLPFFKRDFRLKKKQMPFVAVPGALPPRCQGR
jgi:hypothetical protein